MILAYILLILLPVCLFMYFYYQKSSVIIEREVTNSILQGLKQMGKNLSSTLDGIRETSNILLMNPRLQECLGRTESEDTAVQQINDAKELGKIFASVETNQYVYKVRLFVDKKKMYATENVNFFSLDQFNSKDWSRNVIAQNGGIYWKSTYPENYLSNDEVYVISVARILKNLGNYTAIAGVIVVDVLEADIFKVLSDFNLPNKKENIFLIDAAGVILSHADKSKIGTMAFPPEDYKNINAANEGIYKIRDGHSYNYIIYHNVNITGWKMIVKIAASDIIGRNETFNSISTLIFVVITLIIFIFIGFLIFAFAVERMARHIKGIVDIMKKEGLENIDDNIFAGGDDINKLEESVKSMIKTVKSLTEESFQAKVKERDAQLKALQAQINPHFLYNTLDTINWMAIRRNAPDIMYMLDSLAKYFRLSLNKGRDIVSAADELELARVYLEIQKARFGDTLHFSFTIDEEIKQYFMPKLTLQPVIENAILHGIQKKKDHTGRIEIYARRRDENIIITVLDDGVGIEPEKLNNLVANLHNDTGHGYGLYNVNERLKLLFGEGAGVFVSSEPGKGTKVEIVLQIRMQHNS